MIRQVRSQKPYTLARRRQKKGRVQIFLSTCPHPNLSPTFRGKRSRPSVLYFFCLLPSALLFAFASDSNSAPRLLQRRQNQRGDSRRLESRPAISLWSAFYARDIVGHARRHPLRRVGSDGYGARMSSDAPTEFLESFARADLAQRRAARHDSRRRGLERLSHITPTISHGKTRPLSRRWPSESVYVFNENRVYAFTLKTDSDTLHEFCGACTSSGSLVCVSFPTRRTANWIRPPMEASGFIKQAAFEFLFLPNG